MWAVWAPRKTAQLHCSWSEGMRRIRSRRKRALENETKELLAGGKREGGPRLPQKQCMPPAVKRGGTGLFLPSCSQNNTFPQGPAGLSVLRMEWAGPLWVAWPCSPWKAIRTVSQVERKEVLWFLILASWPLSQHGPTMANQNTKSGLPLWCHQWSMTEL